MQLWVKSEPRGLNLGRINIKSSCDVTELCFVWVRCSDIKSQTMWLERIFRNCKRRALAVGKFEAKGSCLEDLHVDGRRIAERGSRPGKKEIRPHSTPARADRLKNLHGKSERLSVAEWLGLRSESVHSSNDDTAEKDKTYATKSGPGALPDCRDLVICTGFPALSLALDWRKMN